MSCLDEISAKTAATGDTIEAIGAHVRSVYSTYQDLEDELDKPGQYIFQDKPGHKVNRDSIYFNRH